MPRPQLPRLPVFCSDRCEVGWHGRRRAWQNPFYYNFDTVTAALVCMFEMSSTEGWTSVCC